MKKRKILKILFVSFSIVSVLFAVLVAHIYMVTKNKMAQPDDRQLSRIDFTQKPDSMEANKIRSLVAHLDGVESTFFNVKDGILVYTYSLKKQNSIGVYNKVMNSGNYRAKRFVVDASQAPKGCPAMGGNGSFMSILYASIAKIF